MYFFVLVHLRNRMNNKLGSENTAILFAHPAPRIHQQWRMPCNQFVVEQIDVHAETLLGAVSRRFVLCKPLRQKRDEGAEGDQQNCSHSQLCTVIADRPSHPGQAGRIKGE